MLPFCGYHMGDYFAHWLAVGKPCRRHPAAHLPRQLVPQGRRDGEFLWPGFGENSRVLAWVFGRCDGTAAAVESPIGLLPAPGALDVDGLGLGLGEDRLAALLHVDTDAWRANARQIDEHFARFGARLPAELSDELRELRLRLGAGH